MVVRHSRLRRKKYCQLHGVGLSALAWGQMWRCCYADLLTTIQLTLLHHICCMCQCSYEGLLWHPIGRKDGDPPAPLLVQTHGGPASGSNRSGVQGVQGAQIEPPGPLLTHLHTVYMACSEFLPTRLNPLAERTCFPQAGVGRPVPLRAALELHPAARRPRVLRAPAELPRLDRLRRALLRRRDRPLLQPDGAGRAGRGGAPGRRRAGRPSPNREARLLRRRGSDKVHRHADRHLQGRVRRRRGVFVARHVPPRRLALPSRVLVRRRPLRQQGEHGQGVGALAAGARAERAHANAGALGR